MKALNEHIEQAMKLVGSDDYYIIFNDGKPIRTHLDEDIILEMDHYFDANDYRLKTETPLIREIEAHSHFSPTLQVNKNANIKVIHINDEEQYIDYHLMINDGVVSQITNIYLKVTGKTKVKMDVVVEDEANLMLKNITNAYDDLTINIRSFCLREATLTIDDLVISDESVNCKNSIYLMGEKSQCSMNNTVINTTGKQQSFEYEVHHEVRDTTSEMNTYGISKNTSSLVFRCCGSIVKGAKGAIMNQKTKGLIMDLHSSITGIPVLEIDENEVNAHHGAAIGAIDEEELYYLMSRGLTREVSERLIVTTLIAPYYKNIKDEKILAYIHQEIETQLQH